MSEPNHRVPHHLHHTVPATYLAGFADPQTQRGRLWVLDQDLRIKAGTPKKTLRDSDFYEVRLPNGRKSLVVETGFLKSIEDRYGQVKRKILHQLPLGVDEKAALALFIASMLARSPVVRESQQDFLNRVLEQMDALEALPDEVKRQMVETPISNSNREYSMTSDEVRKAAEDVPSSHSASIPGLVMSLVQYVAAMKMNILVNENVEEPFFTSDHPCVMVNPELERHYGRGTMYASPGLAQQSVEISLPISPKYSLICGYNMINDLQYTAYSPRMNAVISTINSRTTRMARKLVARDKTQLEAVRARSQAST